MDIDRKFFERMTSISHEERIQLMKMFECCKREPAVVISIAMFRDTFMFREMATATIMKYQNEVRSLKSRIDRLEEDKREGYGKSSLAIDMANRFPEGYGLNLKEELQKAVEELKSKSEDELEVGKTNTEDK